MPLVAAGSMRVTWPETMPSRVSIFATWPMDRSRVRVSEIRISAFSREGIGYAHEVRARADLPADLHVGVELLKLTGHGST